VLLAGSVDDDSVDDDSVDGVTSMDSVAILDASVDPDRFASSMYAQLRECDRMGVRDVIVVLPNDSGIGSAIRDRIFKASVRD
jgi:hypothetical protein